MEVVSSERKREFASGVGVVCVELEPLLESLNLFELLDLRKLRYLFPE